MSFLTSSHQKYQLSLKKVLIVKLFIICFYLVILALLLTIFHYQAFINGLYPELERKMKSSRGVDELVFEFFFDYSKNINFLLLTK